MHHFYGYGKYQADYWFVGMEEGGDDTFEEVSQCLAVWGSRGHQEEEDVAAYHLALALHSPLLKSSRGIE